MKYLVRSIESGVSVNAMDVPRGPGETGVLKTSCVSTGTFNENENKTVVADEVRLVACPVRAGRAIVSRMNTPQLVGAAGYVREEVSGLYLPDRLWQIDFGPDSSAAFLVWWMQTRLYRDQVSSGAVGTSASMQNISQSDFRELVLTVPAIGEQRAIADYLDAETSKSDTLITKQQRLIVTLRERRGAIIQREVDKTDAVVAPLKYRMSVTDCKHVTAEFVDSDDSYPLASIRECQGATVDLTYAKRTTKKYFDLLRDGGRVPRTGDLVMTRNASVGLVARVTDATPPFAMGQDVCLLHQLAPGLIEPRYAQYALRSHGAVEQFELNMIGSTFRRINVEDIRSLKTRWPSADVQLRVADYLDEQTARIDQLIAKTERFIRLSRERRAALITRAVTGQIDVRTARAT